MFKQITDKINYQDVEKNILAFWEQHGIFERSIADRESGPVFTFYEGPPTANGKPGIHHVVSRTLKDLVCRYKTMRGYKVQRKAGWDTHGLPVEIEVEKKLGIKHKDEIFEYGVEKFNKECYQSVFTYLKDWEEMTRYMGYWINLDDAYVTCTREYIESVWWALDQYYKKGLIYRGHKIQPYCPRCETPLSSHEVSQGYQDVKDPSIYVRMRVKEEENTSFLVWTTTPWTLISNVALAVHPSVTYVKVRAGDEFLILAEERLSVLEGEYETVKKYTGADLIGLTYERLFGYVPVTEKAFYVVGGEFVTTEDGSGIVHMAPAFGEDDYQTGRKHGLPTLQPVNKSGEFTDDITDFKGMFVKDADPEIIKYLKQRELMYKKETITHSYPHCWRCQSPLLYYARSSWYIKTTAYAERMTELNKQINWVPPEVGTGRFGNWLAENKDWALSRDRFWGTPLPIWVCGSCGKEKSIGSLAELAQGTWRVDGVTKPIDPASFDPHKPYVDQVEFDCSCGGVMRRIPELIDVWFDSGSMPFAQWHYPFENKDIFEKNFPADYICEGIDQTRGWFYTLHSIASALFDKPAFKNVLVNELILDKDGQKMSKSRGNTVDPFDILTRYGADTLRWYLITTSPPWRPTLFDEEGLKDVQRRFLSTFVNTYSFFALYANIDGYDGSEAPVPVGNRQEIDRWILSELNTLYGTYRDLMDEYNVTHAARAVSDFTIDKLSNWYVRRNRRRFWKSEKGQDKTAAYQTLYECMTGIVKMMAPFAPFLADELFRNLNNVTGRETSDSVHLTLLPEKDARLVDSALERKMDLAQRVVYLSRSVRAKTNLKVRQPLKRVIVSVHSQQDRDDIVKMERVILEEINVKALEFVTDESGLVNKKARPNFKSIGPKYGKNVQAVAQRIKEFTTEEILQLERHGVYSIRLNGTEFSISKEDIEITTEDIKGWVVESDGVVTVALDTELTDELRAEGLAREFVNRIQNMRKESGFQVTDRIRILYRSEDLMLAKTLGTFGDYIKIETLAQEITEEAGGTSMLQEVVLNGIRCALAVEVIAPIGSHRIT
jgi:isoleucyl-tRNA synthetase